MFKVGKVLLLSLLVVGLCAPLALATTSRVQALAGASSYINDDSDVFRWYGTLPSYSKMVMAEAGQAMGGADVSADYQAMGFTHDWGEDHWLGTWGVFLFMNSIEDGSFTLFNPLSTPGQGPDLGFAIPSTKFALSWGKEMESVAIGLAFTRSDAMEMVADGDEENYNFTTFGGGLRVDINEEAYFDVSATLGFAGGDTLGGFDKSLSYVLEARMFWEFLENATFVPYLGYNAANFAFQDAVAPSGDKWSQLGVGGALNFDVNTNNMLIFAAEIQRVNWEFSKADGNKGEVLVTAVPKLFMALESDVTSWFTFRVGATKTMTKTVVTDADGDEYKYTYAVDILSVDPVVVADASDFSWHMGGGFHVGEWDIDATFSHELPFRLGYWLTGYGAGDPDPVVGRVSATYRF